MKDDKIFSFLKALKKNNNREWFEKNKPKYMAAKAEFEFLVHDLIKGISKFDKKFSPDTDAKDCIFRIYKDVRFSKDKTPYKTHFGAYFSPGGRKSSVAGYYFHMEPGNVFLAGGNWQPEAPQLNAIRQEIDYNGGKLESILNSKNFRKYFNGLSDEDKLKTVPKGYDKDNKRIELLKLKSFISYCNMADKRASAKDFDKQVCERFKAMFPLIVFLREAGDN